MAQTLLQVEDLHTQFFTSRGVVRAVDGVSLHIDVGETLGIVGESGCGKTITALSILRLVPDPGKIVSGRILFRGNDVVKMDDEEIRDFRGNDVAMIFQDPMTSLNPVTKIGRQIEEAMTAHQRFTPELAKSRVIELLTRVRVPSAERRAQDYPHQFSGGMRQRAMIAMGLPNEPSLLIADEPTTALDVTVQAQIIQLMKQLNRELGTAMMLITHNMALVASLCQRVVVMYAGRVVEEGPVEQIFKSPRGAERPAGQHQRASARPLQPAARLQVSSPVSFRSRPLQGRGAATGGGRSRAGRTVLGSDAKRERHRHRHRQAELDIDRRGSEPEGA